MRVFVQKLNPAGGIPRNIRFIIFISSSSSSCTAMAEEWADRGPLWITDSTRPEADYYKPSSFTTRPRFLWGMCVCECETIASIFVASY